VSALPPLGTGGPHRAGGKGESPRKAAQIGAIAAVALPIAARARRVVDVGSGHGHLTRAIGELIAQPVIGLERDASLTVRARSLVSSASPTFAVTDVLQCGLAVSVGDCVIGLHACGELGDVMVASVAEAGGASLVLVACCPQKRRQASRQPLCDLVEHRPRLDLPRALLGLGNLAAGDSGVEATRPQNLAARERRLALNRLLSDACGALRIGAEMDGLNRRAAQRDLSLLVARAFALRGLPAPRPAAIEAAAEWARAAHARARRWSVPRAILARVLEVYVLLDRAAYLEVRGLAVDVGVLFPAEVSPRNLALLAQP
jgi:hypothetical protein